MDDDKDTIIGTNEFTIGNLDDYIIDASILTNTMNSASGTFSINNNNGTYNFPTITIGQTGAAGSNGSWGSTNPYIYTTNNTGLKVTSDAEFDGDIKWKGRSLGKMLENIEKRLAILVPDPEKLDHFEALKKAYEHYKTLEALCEIPKKEKD